MLSQRSSLCNRCCSSVWLIKMRISWKLFILCFLFIAKDNNNDFPVWFWHMCESYGNKYSAQFSQLQTDFARCACISKCWIEKSHLPYFQVDQCNRIAIRYNYPCVKLNFMLNSCEVDFRMTGACIMHVAYSCDKMWHMGSRQQ